MGGSSGIIAADTKVELKRLAIQWYQRAFDTNGMFPRVDVTDFKDRKEIKKEGCESILLAGNIESAIICIKPMEEFNKDSHLYKWLKPELRDKKFGCIVSAHT